MTGAPPAVRRAGLRRKPPDCRPDHLVDDRAVENGGTKPRRYPESVGDQADRRRGTGESSGSTATIFRPGFFGASGPDRRR